MYNQTIKSSIYKWRDGNREEYNKYMLEVYYKDATNRKMKRMKHYYYQKEAKAFLSILLEN